MTAHPAKAARYCPKCGDETAQEHCPKDGTPTFQRALRADAVRELTIGDVVGGRYRIQGILGQGGFGAVYAAEHVMTGQAAAVKIMVGDAAGTDDETVQRFLQEARITASLSHPNTVRIYDFGQTDGGILFMAMEHLRGPTLDGHLKAAVARGTALSEFEAATIGVHVLRSLTEAHAAGLVHRDLKPANLILVQMIGEPQLVKVLDFGIARIHGSALTQQGTALGTPTYMSPEQGRAEVADARSDLYALGCILFACVAGRPPFADSNPMAVLLAHQLNPLPNLREFAKVPVSDAFVAVVERATAKRAEDRFASAIAMREALEAVLALPRPPQADPVWDATLEADVLPPPPPSQAVDPDSRATVEADVVAPASRPSAQLAAASRRAPAPSSVGERISPSTRLRQTAATATPKPVVNALRRQAGDEDSSTRRGLPSLPATVVAAAQELTPIPVVAARRVAGPKPAVWVAAACGVVAMLAGALWWSGRDRAVAVAPLHATAPTPTVPVVAAPVPQPSKPIAAQPVEPALVAPPPVAEPVAQPAEKLEPEAAPAMPVPPPTAEVKVEKAPDAAVKPPTRPAVREPRKAPRPTAAPPTDRKKAFDLL